MWAGGEGRGWGRGRGGAGQVRGGGGEGGWIIQIFIDNLIFGSPKHTGSPYIPQGWKWDGAGGGGLSSSGAVFSYDMFLLRNRLRRIVLVHRRINHQILIK